MLRTTSLALVLALPTAALAQSGEDMKSTKLLERGQDGWELTDAAVSGQALLEADLYSDLGTEQTGQITDILLDESGEISTVKFSTTRFRDFDREGWMAVDRLDITGGLGTTLDVEPEGDTPPNAGEDVRLTRDDVETRLLSEILRNRVTVGAQDWMVEDVVFDRSGKASYVLLAERDSGMFGGADNVRALPFEALSYQGEGAFTIDGADPAALQVIVIR
ncbi:MAG: hypothetical protein V2J26_06465 [Pacificimonas sp.]|jgi:hypothetical protein|nr:hypothetical protein [Pacificimonas sp.]